MNKQSYKKTNNSSKTILYKPFVSNAKNKKYRYINYVFFNALRLYKIL